MGSLPTEGRGQAPPKHEFRGAWIATVANLDWPETPTTAPAQQQDDLIRHLDSLKAAGINAVFFQIRTEADALYASDREPWSYWLTGEQGRPPEPFYDPLQFVIEEAHARGMEVHAWFNPFRAAGSASYVRSDEHVTNAHPEWLLEFEDGPILLNPGLPQVRTYVTQVVLDVATRYAIDGVHFDDYFYPYPPHHMDQDGNRTKDRDAFEADRRGFDDIEDWRRDNINRFVQQVHDSLRVRAPEVTFGISPFGIWKDGAPSGITGLSAYHTIYADAVAWLEAQTIDYLAPQLYWPFGGSQDYGTLAPWWAEQARTGGRHLYLGLAAYRADDATKSMRISMTMNPALTQTAPSYGPSEVPRQLRFNRKRSDIQGSVLFRTENITRLSSQGLADSLQSDLYRTPALTPSFAWRDTTAPAAPTNLRVEQANEQRDEVTLQWNAPSDDTSAPRYAVYRVAASRAPDVDEATQRPEHLHAVTGQTTFSDRLQHGAERYHYAVTAVSQNSVESAPSASVAVEVPDRPPAESTSISANYPNPFTETTTLVLDLPASADVTVDVYDALGRHVLQMQEHFPAGAEEPLRIDGSDFASGVYLYRTTIRLEDEPSHVKTGQMVKVNP